MLGESASASGTFSNVMLSFKGVKTGERAHEERSHITFSSTLCCHIVQVICFRAVFVCLFGCFFCVFVLLIQGKIAERKYPALPGHDSRNNLSECNTS